jgi:hypothetical protein
MNIIASSETITVALQKICMARCRLDEASGWRRREQMNAPGAVAALISLAGEAQAEIDFVSLELKNG